MNGEQIERVRHNLKMNQMEMAEFLGISYSAYRTWEKGLHSPSFIVMNEIVKLYNKICHKLIEGIPLNGIEEAFLINMNGVKE